MKDQQNVNQKLVQADSLKDDRLTLLEKELKESKDEITTKDNKLIEQTQQMASLEKELNEMKCKVSNLEKDKKVKIEENKILDQLQKKGEEKIKRLEEEIERVGGAEGTLQKELVVLRRENFSKVAILGEIRVKMSEFESRWR